MYAVKNSLVHGGITGNVIGAAMEVHGRLGPGFLESVYDEALAVEFDLQKIGFERQKKIPVFYKDKQVKEFYCDYLIEGKVVVEIKAIKQITEIEKIQVINYLKAGGFEVGLLFNFGEKSLDYKRLVNSKNRNP
ncbi:MAG: GxxExxY protein [Planctomycetes bacterium]|nr:GxxExxY protein [Planctomycetota bacterium]